jgi:hypothetical protein
MLMRDLWTQDSLDFEGEFHRIDKASINPRPEESIPIWFGGSAPALIERVARLGDGWMPLMGANEKAAECIRKIREAREREGKNMDGFGIQAQAQYNGGTPDIWKKNATSWRKMGATHLAIATHNAGVTDVPGHLSRVEEYLKAVQ